MSGPGFSTSRRGEMARLIDAHDWASHPFGPPDTWSRALQSGLNFLLDAAFPAAMFLGPELRLIYNDAYAPILGPRHPRALGAPGREIWGELWEVIGPQFAEVMSSGRGMAIQNQKLMMTRHGYTEETYWDYSFSPLRNDAGYVTGVFNEAHDVTAAEFQRRDDKLIIALNAQLMALGSADEIIKAALRLVGEHLGAKRTGFGEIDVDAAIMHIDQLWVTGTMVDIRGDHTLGSFGNMSQDLQSGRTVVVGDSELDPRASDPVTLDRFRALGVRAAIVVPIIDRGKYVGAIFVQDDVPRRWAPHQILFAEAAARKLWTALLRFRTETALRDRDQSYRLIFEQAHDIIFTADTQQRITACNSAGATALGYRRDEIIGQSISDFVSPDDFKQTTAMLQHKLDHGGNTRHEVTVTGADGRQMRWENDSTLLVDSGGHPIGLLSISRDVTERRAFESRQALLIHELNHRVKNTLALVQAIAHQSFRTQADGVLAPDNFMARLRTLAGAHDLLTREHWEGVTLADLVRAATAPLEAGRVAQSGETLVVTPKAAVALAMALHELGTNAVKYGALSAPEGRIRVAWQTAQDFLRFEWHEHDGPPVTVPDRQGFGIKMIERALASDLGGKVEVDFARDGLRCTIEAPLRGNVT